MGFPKQPFWQPEAFLKYTRELRDTGVVVGSFKPGVVDTSMQGTIRSAPESSLPSVQRFVGLKEKAETLATTAGPRPPPAGALDTPTNVAHFVEFLLLGTTDQEFANADDPSEWDIRHAQHYARWIPPENLPRDE